MTNTDNLLHAFKQAENTPYYQLQKIIIDVTEQICETMEENGITRADLAQRLGKDRSWVTRILRGNCNLTLKTISDIFWALGYKIEVVFTSRPK